MVFDMSRPGGWFHIPGGASERRFGPGYGRGVQEWLTGQFFPLGPATGPAPASLEFDTSSLCASHLWITDLGIPRNRRSAQDLRIGVNELHPIGNTKGN